MEGKPISQSLLEILACPACDTRPKVEIADGGIRCPECGRIYPVENGIPVMLVEKAAEDESGGKQAR